MFVLALNQEENGVSKLLMLVGRGIGECSPPTGDEPEYRFVKKHDKIARKYTISHIHKIVS